MSGEMNAGQWAARRARVVGVIAATEFSRGVEAGEQYETIMRLLYRGASVCYNRDTNNTRREVDTHG